MPAVQQVHFFRYFHIVWFSCLTEARRLNDVYKINMSEGDLRGSSVAELSPGIVSSVVSSSPSEGRDGIRNSQEVGGHVQTSVTIDHTHYSAILRNRRKQDE